MLDWDKPYNKQPKQVQDALKNSNVAEIWKAQYGFDIEKNQPQMDMVYKAVSEQLGSPEAASQYFKDLGIIGTRYLDEGSRNLKKDWTVEIKDFGGYDFQSLDEAKAFMKSNPQYEMRLIEPQKATSNFVVFPGNEDLLRIKEINDKPIGGLLETAQPKVANNLQDIQNKFPDVGLDVYENKGTINLSKIVVPKEMRSSGVGSSVMNDLVDYADSTGQKIALTPSSDFGGNVKRLKEFYKSFGFVENKGKNKDFSTRETMIRPPNIIEEEKTRFNLLD